jgi:hypothetical protein
VCGAIRPISRLYKAKVCLTPLCPFCGEEEGDSEEETKEHLGWRCSAWEEVRRPHLAALVACDFRHAGGEQREGNPALWYQGVINQDPRLPRHLATIPIEEYEDVLPESPVPRSKQWAVDRKGETFELDPDGTRRRVVGTDGSGLHPRHPLLRRCGYSEFWGPNRSENFGAPLLGATQVVPRSELRAVLRVAQRVVTHTKVVSDCKWVVDGFEHLLRGDDMRRFDHADLWTAFKEVIQSKPAGLVSVVKVKAHLSREEMIDKGANPVHWAVNDGADGLAKRGADGYRVPHDIFMGSRRRARIAVIIQSMWMAILKERAPRFREWLRQKPLVRPNEWKPAQDPLPQRPAPPVRLGEQITEAMLDNEPTQETRHDPLPRAAHDFAFDDPDDEAFMDLEPTDAELGLIEEEEESEGLLPPDWKQHDLPPAGERTSRWRMMTRTSSTSPTYWRSGSGRVWKWGWRPQQGWFGKPQRVTSTSRLMPRVVAGVSSWWTSSTEGRSKRNSRGWRLRLG